MAKNKIEESQQQSQGIAIGTQGNEDISVSQGATGSHRSKEGPEDRHIPNRDRSPASNPDRASGNKGSNP